LTVLGLIVLFIFDLGTDRNLEGFHEALHELFPDTDLGGGETVEALGQFDGLALIGGVLNDLVLVPSNELLDKGEDLDRE
jgi:hypothetical protein